MSFITIFNLAIVTYYNTYSCDVFIKLLWFYQLFLLFEYICSFSYILASSVCIKFTMGRHMYDL